MTFSAVAEAAMSAGAVSALIVLFRYLLSNAKRQEGRLREVVERATGYALEAELRATRAERRSASQRARTSDILIIDPPRSNYGRHFGFGFADQVDYWRKVEAAVEVELPQPAVPTIDLLDTGGDDPPPPAGYALVRHAPRPVFDWWLRRLIKQRAGA